MTNKFECVLGYHNYTISDKHNPHILICENCRKKGHYRSSYGYEIWCDYDDKENEIHWRDASGDEAWYDYDNRGYMIYYRDSDGYEEWLDNNDTWTDKKPENWKYENK
jgi:antibiotic biosynthesis monooxygenase (ABM) superfamily enzyme